MNAAYIELINGQAEVELEPSTEYSVDKKIVKIIAISCIAAVGSSTVQTFPSPTQKLENVLGIDKNYISSNNFKDSYPIIENLKTFNQTKIQNQFVRSFIPQTSYNEIVLENLNGISIAFNNTFEQLNSIISPSDDKINNKENVEERNETMLYNKMIEKRNKFEKSAMVHGVFLALVTLSLSFLIPVFSFAASVPTSVMFLSIPGFMALRRYMRGENDV
ncbi:hypothetical protein [Bacillus cihuensis]|uniref:hypothetical protein n=1 Tax=Bacillus cihuensis TaxID=1208599 RepID=UPI0004279BD3|nr:hypothetical protein [Bacillus cihuensis]